jgi:nucleotide-binding universal stress UspA family protein
MAAPERILVATDFSEPARLALDAAIALAKRSGAELHLCHAVDIALPLAEPHGFVLPVEWVSEARRIARGKLDEEVARVRAQGLTTSAQLGDGPAAYAIAEHARQLGADLVAIGTHGHTGLKHVLLGSVAERTIEHAPCSVWVVKAGGRPAEPRAIVVGTDFSASAGEAVERAAEWARLARARLHLVHALPLPMPLIAPYELALPEGLLESARREAARQLDSAAQAAKSHARGDVTTELATPPVHIALAEAAKRLPADLIVTGSRGHTGVKHALLGSVAERTARYAPCSVLVVRPKGG